MHDHAILLLASFLATTALLIGYAIWDERRNQR